MYRKQFEYMLSYAQALPKYAPDFHRYLLAYPEAKPARTEDLFYWAKVKFGLKPTLRVVQLITMRGHVSERTSLRDRRKNNFIRAITSRQPWTSRFASATLLIPSSPASTSLRRWAPSKPV